MSAKDKVLRALGGGEALDDDQLASRVGVNRTYINSICRGLVGDGRIVRERGLSGKLANRLEDSPGKMSALSVAAKPSPGLHLTEDEVKRGVMEHLERAGYTIDVRWGRTRGVDIDAHRGSARFIIEAKRAVASPQQQGNSFDAALGELVREMADPNATYGLALPDNPRYRGLVARLPSLAVSRLNLVFFFVHREGDRLEVIEVDANGAAPSAR